MDDDGWVQQAQAAARPCPSCASVAARPIVYGMPLGDDFQRLQGRVVFAGCLVPEVPYRYSCGTCGAMWGPDDSFA